MSTLQEQVARCQKKTITQLKNMQNADGSWSFCFEGPVMTNSFFILLLTSFEEKGNKELIVKLAKGIREKQRPDGTFTNYPGEEKGNVTATVQGSSECLRPDVI